MVPHPGRLPGLHRRASVSRAPPSPHESKKGIVQIMNKTKTARFLSLLVPLACLSGCGGGDGSALVSAVATEPSAAAGTSGNPSAPAGGAGLNIGGAAINVPDAPAAGQGGDFDPDSDEVCGTSAAAASLAPVYLVVLLDQSGSMGDGQNGDRKEKWDPVTQALKAFFADPESAGIIASLSLFPADRNHGDGPADGDFGLDCDNSAYDTPVVDPTTLPNGNVFAQAIDAVAPPNEWGTPTYPALSGTVDYAESLYAQDSSRQIAIVMVTDGEPFGCDGQGNNIENTADVAASVADRFPTYVVGVGERLDNLNQIARRGGTDRAFIVAVDDPEQTRTELLGAIDQIRGDVMSCELGIPSPPDGKQLDKGKVNVDYTPSVGNTLPLSYTDDCSETMGWRYDDVGAPSQIVLCADTCDAVRAEPEASVNVVFGCATRGGEDIVF